MKRRDFIIKTTHSCLAVTAFGLYSCKQSENKGEVAQDLEKPQMTANELFFNISLAQWSLHGALQSGAIDNLDFAAMSNKFGCKGVEYVNAFFPDKAKEMSYLKEMNNRAKSEGQQNVLIMIDGEGALANNDKKRRFQAIENHFKWVDAAHFLGCHAIRVNLAGGKDKVEAVKSAVDSLEQLSDFAKDSNINILVENHGGFSSNGDWMQDVFSSINKPNCGTLPDFGNFCIKKDKEGQCDEAYDRYKGMEQLLPYAKAVSAKSYDFDADGNETTIDYLKMMEMLKNSGYNGFVGIEYEGKNYSEEEGIKLTRDLLINVGKQLRK